jgi:hypothetical protein
MRLLGGVCVATFVVMLDALCLESHPAFAQEASAVQGAGPRFRDDGPNADAFGQERGVSDVRGHCLH